MSYTAPAAGSGPVYFLYNKGDVTPAVTMCIQLTNFGGHHLISSNDEFKAAIPERFAACGYAKKHDATMIGAVEDGYCMYHGYGNMANADLINNSKIDVSWWTAGSGYDENNTMMI